MTSQHIVHVCEAHGMSQPGRGPTEFDPNPAWQWVVVVFSDCGNCDPRQNAPRGLVTCDRSRAMRGGAGA